MSALHGRGIGELEAALVEALPPRASRSRSTTRRRRRASRSSDARTRASAACSTASSARTACSSTRARARRATRSTRSSSATASAYVFIDTAGIRRKAKVAKEASAVESLSVLSRHPQHRAGARRRADVRRRGGRRRAGREDPGLAEERGRGDGRRAQQERSARRRTSSRRPRRRRARSSRSCRTCPIVRTSAKTGRGVGGALRDDRPRARRLLPSASGRASSIASSRRSSRLSPPPTMGGRAPRLYYVTQAEVAPPTFVAMTNAPDSIHFSYRRFVVNQLRKHFGFEGVPVRVHYKARRREAKASRRSAARRSRRRASRDEPAARGTAQTRRRAISISASSPRLLQVVDVARELAARGRWGPAPFARCVRAPARGARRAPRGAIGVGVGAAPDARRGVVLERQAVRARCAASRRRGDGGASAPRAAARGSGSRRTRPRGIVALARAAR